MSSTNLENLEPMSLEEGGGGGGDNESADQVIVLTKNGMIKGTTAFTKEKNLKYKAFLGIPYAEPPIGHLRFEPPVPKKNWNGVLTTTKQGNPCIQTGKDNTSEDCLYLNVYVPDYDQPTFNLPVMVWIHGGGFVVGSTEDAIPDFLLEKDIIFVSMNYRLGIFGFLSTGDLIVPGNMGLKDQLMAMKWVKDNIEIFGGDPNNVTLFGQSAGSVSTSYHIMSPKSTGLFNRAIMDSGVALCPWGLSKVYKESIKLVAKHLNIETVDLQQLVDELKKISAEDLLKAASTTLKDLLLKDTKNGLVFVPVEEPEHEGAFFTGKCYELLKAGNYNKVPILLGYNSLEGAFNFSGLLRLILLMFDLKPKSLVPNDMNAREEDKKKIAKKIKREYFGCKSCCFCCCCCPSIFLSNTDAAMMWVTDNTFVRPIYEFAKFTSNSVPTFFYEFGYVGLLGDPKRNFKFPTHAEELNYIFVVEDKAKNELCTEYDRKCREKIVEMWTNFAKYENPTPERCELLDNIIWPPVDKTFPFLKIMNKLEVLHGPKREKMEFWEELYAKYGQPPYDTY